ncbi:MAG: GHKL domain-containing protein [Clostridia bacterium]|nr:GHKL domain-containing protein [Clostridia bacterium]
MSAALVSLLENSLELRYALTLLDAVFSVSSCVLLTRLWFGLIYVKKLYVYVLISFLTFGSAVLSVQREADPARFGDWVLTVGLLVPFICVALLFFSKDVWKALIAALCCDAALGALKYVLLMFTGYDYLRQNSAEELLAGAFVSFLLFSVLFAITLIRKKLKKNSEAAKINAPLFVLIAVTTIVFVLSMVILGLNNTAQRRTEFFITLSNIPLFALTIGYAVKSFLKARLAQEHYEKTLSLQLEHFESMEKKNDELRMFRHDLPKKLRPLLMCVREGRNEEAQELIKSFNVELEASRPRFSTGNISFDTVLECEQQAAEKCGVSLVLAPGSVFPSHGVDPADIYTMFSNALDNAIEAAAKTAGDRSVRVSCGFRAGVVFASVENPFSGELKLSGESLKTTKDDREFHGYGLRSIKKTAGKYNGKVSFTHSEGVFTLQIELHVG